MTRIKKYHKSNIFVSVNKVCHIIVAPILRYILPFLVIVFFLYLPENIIWSGFLLKLKVAIARIPTNFQISYFIAYLSVVICYLLSQINKVVANLLVWIIAIFWIVVSLVDIFLFSVFGMHFNTVAFQLIAETTFRESKEFLLVYVFSWNFLCAIVAVAICIGAIIYMHKYNIIGKLKDLLEFQMPKVIKLPIIYILTLFSICSVVFYCACIPSYFTYDWFSNLGAGIQPSVKETFYFKFRNSIIQYISEQHSFDKCAKSQTNIDAYLFGETKSVKNIVLVIGESHSKHHSSLYGYDKQTNPNLSNIGNLLVFKDVISPINRTTQSFHYFLSMTSNDESEQWYDKPLVLSIFKKVGYNVVFWSNQFTCDLHGDQYEASAGFFFHPKIKPFVFSHYNTTKHQYDMDLVDDFELHKKQFQKDSMNLFIIHLNGQHVFAHERYPSNYCFFTDADYSNRSELSSVEKKQVAEYDNATRYNDFVLSNIISIFKGEDAIIIYFSDHGEEVNDFRSHIGKSYDFDIAGAPALHCHLDIPFVIYYSDIFQQRHASLVQKLRNSVDKPFMSDDLPHLLLELSNIRTKYFNPSRSLINENYDINRKRYIIDYAFWGKIDYDDVCDKYGNWNIGYSNKKAK